MTEKGGWSEYWEQDGNTGEVFVSCKGERHPALPEHWRKVFADVARGSSVLDIASGGGSIFASLSEDHGLDLFATDIAASALEQLAARIPDVTMLVSSANALPFADRTFDIVVSQFGIEYAGTDAFAEAARVVNQRGRLAVLAHIRDGYIDSTNKAQLAEAEFVHDSGFIERAVELTKTAFGNDASRLVEAEHAFMPLITSLGESVQRCHRGVHSYLLSGFRKLYENRVRYDCTDIVDWLEGMNGEVARAIDRLCIMRSAASSESDMQAIKELLSAAGFGAIHLDHYRVPNSELPLAWDLRATRES